MAGLPEGRGRLGVFKALLCLQELAVGDQDGRDGVPELVQADVAATVPANEGLEPVAEAGAARPLLVAEHRRRTAKGLAIRRAAVVRARW